MNFINRDYRLYKLQRRVVRILVVCLVCSVMYVGLSTTKVYFIGKELTLLESQQEALKQKQAEYLEKEAEQADILEELELMENGMTLPNIAISASGQIQIESILFHIREAVPMIAKLYDAQYKDGAIRVRGVTRDVASVAQMAGSFSKEYQVYIGNVQEITHNEEGYIPFSILISLDRTKTREAIETIFSGPLEGVTPLMDGSIERSEDAGLESENREVE